MVAVSVGVRCSSVLSRYPTLTSPLGVSIHPPKPSYSEQTPDLYRPAHVSQEPPPRNPSVPSGTLGADGVDDDDDSNFLWGSSASRTGAR